MAESPKRTAAGLGSVEGPLKRLKLPEDIGFRLSWRGSPSFTDWTLAWAEERTIPVHRVILVSGTRPAHFFAGATNEEFRATSTDLSKLLPAPCQGVLDKALDFMYGEPLNAETGDLPPLHKLADVLQCTSLKNATLDAMAERCAMTDEAQELLRAAVASCDDSLLEAIVLSMPAKDIGKCAPALVEASPRAAISVIQHMAHASRSYEKSGFLVRPTEHSRQRSLKDICGRYHRVVTEHEHPVYVNVSSDRTCFMYFWNSLEEPPGWWLGPTVGGDEVWAGCATCDGSQPPRLGWRRGHSEIVHIEVVRWDQQPDN